MRNQFFKATAALGLSVLASGATASRAATFEIKVQNVTAANGLSPFIAFASTSDYSLVNVGKAASAGLATLAETGDRTTLRTELQETASIFTIAEAEGGPSPAGDEKTVTLVVPDGLVQSGGFLHVAAMIGRSNDSFIAVANLPLERVAHGNVLRLNATNFDAGSEANTGNVEDFGAGGHPTDGAEGHVSYDRGLNPRGNADEILAWGPVAAVVTVQRIH